MNVEIAQMGNRISFSAETLLNLPQFPPMLLNISHGKRHRLTEIPENETSCCIYRAVPSLDQFSAFTPCSLGTRAHEPSCSHPRFVNAASKTLPRSKLILPDPLQSPETLPGWGSTSPSAPGCWDCACGSTGAERAYTRWNTCVKVKRKLKREKENTRNKNK